MNLLTIIGRVGKPPEIKNLENGKVAKFSFAVSEKFTKNGEKTEQTEWFNCVVYGKLSDVVEKYVTKGDHLALTGKIKSRKYQDKDGLERTIYEVFVGAMEMLGGKKQESEQEPDKAAEKATQDFQSPIDFDQPEQMDDLPF